MGDRRRDNTTERSPEPKTRRENKPGGYYYDDITGYEIYKPSDDDEEDEKDVEQGDEIPTREL